MFLVDCVFEELIDFRANPWQNERSLFFIEAGINRLAACRLFIVGKKRVFDLYLDVGNGKHIHFDTDFIVDADRSDILAVHFVGHEVDAGFCQFAEVMTVLRNEFILKLIIPVDIVGVMNKTVCSQL